MSAAAVAVIIITCASELSRFDGSRREDGSIKEDNRVEAVPCSHPRTHGRGSAFFQPAKTTSRSNAMLPCKRRI